MAKALRSISACPDSGVMRSENHASVFGSMFCDTGPLQGRRNSGAQNHSDGYMSFSFQKYNVSGLPPYQVPDHQIHDQDNAEDDPRNGDPRDAPHPVDRLALERDRLLYLSARAFDLLLGDR